LTTSTEENQRDFLKTARGSLRIKSSHLTEIARQIENLYMARTPSGQKRFKPII